MSNKQKIIKFLLSHDFEMDGKNSFFTDTHYVNLDNTNTIELMDEDGNNFIEFSDFESFKTYLIENNIVQELKDA